MPPDPRGGRRVPDRLTSVYRRLVDAPSLGLVALDAGGSIQAFSRGASELSGFSEEQLVGESFAAVMGDGAAFARACEKATRTGAADVVLTLRTRGGQLRAIRLNIRPEGPRREDGFSMWFFPESYQWPAVPADAEASGPSLLEELRQGIARRELEVYFQPQVELRTGHVYGVEALARWDHPRRGPISPGVFIPLAEQSGLVKDLTELVLDESLRQARRWNDEGENVSVAVNLSMGSLYDLHVVEVVETLLGNHGVPARQLELEITESEAMRDPIQAGYTLRALRQVGCRTALDDFGTGHSALAHLKALAVDVLKIDRSLVQDLANSAEDRAIVESTADLARRLGLSVVAEGVSSEQCWRAVADTGCPNGQGYWLGRPAPAEHVDLTDLPVPSVV